MNARPVASSAASTRQQILDSALTVFSARGYSAASIRDILHAAGVTQPTLYYHFHDKADLFRSLVESLYGASLKVLREQVESVEGVENRLRVLIGSSFEYSATDPRIPQVMFQTYFGPVVPEVVEVLEHHSTARFRFVVEIMQYGIDRGELENHDCEFLALSFCCLMDQPINLFSRYSRPADFLTPALAHATVKLFLNGAGSR